MKNIIISLVVITFLAGCASVGNESLRKETQQTVQQKIFVGKTTQEQVKVHFGNPIETSYNDNGSLEIWKYKFSNVSLDFIGYVPVVNWFASSSSGKEKTLTILFDENSIVKRFSITDSDVKVKTGLINN